MVALLILVVFKLKSDASTPDTDSENVTTKSTLALLLGLGLARMMDVAIGGVLSIVYVSPFMKLPLPKPVLPSVFPDPLMMLSLSIKSM